MIYIWKFCTRRSGSWRDKSHLPRVNRLLPYLAYIKDLPIAARKSAIRFLLITQHPLAPRADGTR